MKNIIESFHQAIEKQETSLLQYNLVKTVLDNYPLDKPLGKAALDVCSTMADKNPALRLLTIGRQDQQKSATNQQDSKAQYENNVEAVVEFSAYGLDLTMLLKQSGLPQASMDMRL